MLAEEQKNRITKYSLIISDIPYKLFLAVLAGGNMGSIKKSFNLDSDLAQKMDEFLQQNPGISFTLLVNQSIQCWLKNPQVALRPVQPVGLEAMDAFMHENADLMDDLSK